MALTCLQIVQTVCNRLGILAPTVAVTSTDQQIIQIVSISNEEGMAQVKRYPFESLVTEATFSTSAAMLQGNMSSIAPGFKAVLNQTMWNRTLRRPVTGSKSPQEWQQAIAMQVTSPYSQYRIKNDQILFYPIPAAGNTVAFEYTSTNWVSKSGGGTSSIWTSDSDTPLLSDDLIILGTIWRWKAAKGLDYAENFNTYEAALADAMAQDGSKRQLNSGGDYNTYPPVVIIPAGNW